MEVKLAKTAGFCWGVKRAVDIVIDTAKNASKPIETYGPLIHNPQVIETLRKKGIVEVDTLQEKGEGVLIVRTHGITPAKRKEIKDRGYTIKDATCPLVMKVQSIIKRHTKKGYSTVIVGDANHAEVVGLVGFAKNCYVINSLEEVAELPSLEKAIVISQTTMSTKKFIAISEELQRKYPAIEVINTICEATESRQSEIEQLSDEVDAMVIVGGKNSSNTKQLANIPSQKGIPTFLIETEKELDREQMKNFEVVGVSAGASTPQWVIDQVIDALQTSSAGSKRYSPAEFLSNSYLMLSFGSIILYAATAQLMGIAFEPLYALTVFSYILGTYLIFNIFDKDSIKENYREKEFFYLNYRRPLQILGVVLLILAFLGFISFGAGYLLVVALLFVASLSYFFTFTPKGVCVSSFSFKRLKDIPNSKDVGVSFSWTVLTVILPYVIFGGENLFALIAGTFFVGTLLYVRSLTLELYDISQNTIVGKESTAVVIGKEKSLKLIAACLVSLALLLLVFTLSGAIGTFGYCCLFSLVYPAGYIYDIWNKEIKSRLLLTYVVDGHFYVLGIFILLWDLFVLSAGNPI